MINYTSKNRLSLKSLACIAAAIALLMGATSVSAQRNPNPGIAPPDSAPYGESYPQWVAEFWKWALPLPLEGHPFTDSNPVYDLSANQSGNVWFWSAPDGPLTRTATLPAGKALFQINYPFIYPGGIYRDDFFASWSRLTRMLDASGPGTWSVMSRKLPSRALRP
jgi:hypothetical protein